LHTKDNISHDYVDKLMTYEFELPELGSDATEGTLVACHVDPEDVVEEGKTVLEVETAKSVSEVSAPVDGRVSEIHAETGDTVDVGDVILTFETDVDVAGGDCVAADNTAAAESDASGDGGPTPAVTRVEDTKDKTDGATDADASEAAAADDAADGPTPAVTRVSNDEPAADLSTGELDGVPESTEVLVIGGGPGGYVAAIRAAQLGLEVTLVEKDALGGTCLNTGCIPSKALIHGADIAHEATSAEALGITAKVETDLGQLVDWKDGVVDQLTGGVEGLCQANGVTLVDGMAAFVGDHRANIATDDGETAVDFEYSIIATGSRPFVLPSFEPDGEHVLYSSDVLDLDAAPDELLVIGAGYIGMELSMALTKLGTEITVIEMFDDVLPMYGDEISRVVRDRATDLGIEFRFGEAATEWRETGGGVEITTETEAGETTDLAADAVAVVAGRQPAADTVNIEAVGLEPTDDGFIETDAQGRTAHDHVFAVGDVAGEPMLAHKAMYEGEVAADAIAGKPASLDATAIPAAVFTDPEIASVGLTSDEAEEAGYNPVVGRMPLGADGRALTMDATDGFVRIVADAASERVLGAEIVAPNASELIAEVTVALEAGMDLEALAGTVHTHPTLSEAVMEAAADARGEAIHTQ
jgi:dihydrolipoamide dehydrogenase